MFFTSFQYVPLFGSKGWLASTQRKGERNKKKGTLPGARTRVRKLKLHPSYFRVALCFFCFVFCSSEKKYCDKHVTCTRDTRHTARSALELG